MSTLLTMRNRLDLITQSHLTPAQEDTLLNRVSQEEMEARAWSRLKGTVVIASVAPYTTGTVSITQGSTSLTGVGTTWTSTMTGYSIRIANDDTLLKFTYVSATTATVETAWAAASVSGGSYSLFPRFYSVSGYQEIRTVTRTLKLLETTQEELDAADPSRRETSNPARRWAPAGRDASENALIELWPIDSTANLYKVEALKVFTTLSANGDIPFVPGAVVENKAISDACASIFALNGDARWDKMAATYYSRYQEELTKAIEADRRQYGIIGQVADVGYGPGLGMDVIYNHDMDD